ncbi:hypothetical protein QBC34DRAFT_453272 [Podospora aff. communis PSN243]|uniref:Uncharacterized protein n=1 Tax=Podospora aff. communis PSN243 TaxID=3040156 RepID=A0AAV9G2P2_9PEZI|nr:hypothetical protein QBC34DRAFT_453272 [Podospora aff. communis PSN243]
MVSTNRGTYRNLRVATLVEERWEDDLEKYRFSAASAAVHFFRAHPGSVVNLRNLNIIEDRESVAYPSCHAQTLIPFCLANPNLRIQHHACLWTNVIQKDPLEYSSIGSRIDRVRLRSHGALSADRITRPVADWMVEAHTLEKKGMPSHSYTLILDGDPLPMKSSKIFQRVRRFGSSDRDVVLRMRDNDWYKIRKFPELLRDIHGGKGLVRCNFDIGEPGSVEDMLEERKDWDIKQWTSDHRTSRPWTKEHFETEPPLPKWIDVLRFNLRKRRDEDPEGWEPDPNWG